MNAMEESPDMGKTQERVTFFTTNLNYTIQIIPEKKGFDGEVPFILPARLIKFEGGHFSTDDEETIRLIRNHKRYKKGRITEERKKEVLEQKTHRGAITSATMEKEAGAEKKPEAQTIKEGSIRVCDVPGCDYAVKDDFAGNKLRMHKLGKHRIGMRPKALKDNPLNPTLKDTQSIVEAKKGLKELEVKK